MLKLNKLLGNKARRQEIQTSAEKKWKSVPHNPLKQKQDSLRNRARRPQFFFFFRRKIISELLANAEAFLHLTLAFQF